MGRQGLSPCRHDVSFMQRCANFNLSVFPRLECSLCIYSTTSRTGSSLGTWAFIGTQREPDIKGKSPASCKATYNHINDGQDLNLRIQAPGPALFLYISDHRYIYAEQLLHQP